MPHDIERCMWSYQRHFRIHQEDHARAVFRKLDPRFEPDLFLVGILDEEHPDRYAACVEPENEFWISSDSFDGVQEAAKSLPAGYPESQVRYGHPRAQEVVTERLRKRSIHETIRDVVAKCPTKPADVEYFASFPVFREGYLVSAVLGLQESIIACHPQLAIDQVVIQEHRSQKVSISLIDATISEFLADVESELGSADAGEGLGALRSPDELIRNAGSRLMMDCAYKCDNDMDHITGWQQFFDACNSLSSLKYEQQPGSGRLIVARRQHGSLRREIVFLRPVSIQDARGARKLLELSSRGLALHTNPSEILGLVEVGEYNPVDEDLFEIRVIGHHHWELVHGEQLLMEVRSGQPRLPIPRFDAERVRIDVPRIFPKVTEEEVERIVRLVAVISTEEHGTTLVIVEDAEAEANRLSNQATMVEPFLATPELIEHLTPIDGAVLLSPAGICHAIGVILDGMATPEGNPARGSRYNSAVRYVSGHEKRLAIVVSEDGGVDLIPDLVPQMRKSDIDRAISELKGIASTSPIENRRYNKLVEWIAHHAYYMLPEHCEAANKLISRIDGDLIKEHPSMIRIVRKPLAQNPRFDPERDYIPE